MEHNDNTPGRHDRRESRGRKDPPSLGGRILMLRTPSINNAINNNTINNNTIILHENVSLLAYMRCSLYYKMRMRLVQLAQ